jgi:hypothetical protein
MLLGVLGLGVIAGAAIGASQRPGQGASSGSLSGHAAAAWVAGVLATTAAAGSAHFSYVSTIKSPEPAFRTTSAGRGIVDFTSGAFSLREVDHQIDSEASAGRPAREVPQTFTEESIGIGKSMYINFSSPMSIWVRFPDREPHVALGLDQSSGAEEALGGLVGTPPVVSVRDLGQSTVRGVSTTRYRVTNQSLRYCLSHGKKITLSLVSPTTLWVDGQGRIVQAVGSQRFSSASFAKIDAFNHRPAPPPSAPTTTTAVLRFSNFGEPVHIIAPALGPNQPTGHVMILKENPPKKGLCRS